jgi:hypothetical protein
MPKQDNKSKEAIPSHPKAIARKLVTTDLSAFVVGPEARAGLKSFSARHPVLRVDQPNNNSAENENILGGGAVKDDTTRRADYELGQDEKAYHEGQPQYPQVGSVAKKAVGNIVKKTLEFNAQKKGAVGGHSAAEHEASETEGDKTTQSRPKLKEKLPKTATGKALGEETDDDKHFEAQSEKMQTAINLHLRKGKSYKEAVAAAKKHVKEEYLSELGEPMAPAPATSDSPGWSGDTGKDTSDNTRQDSQSGDKGKTSEGSDETVEQARDALEQIAMASAELFENIPDDMKLPSWVLEKLQLAQQFVSSVQDHVSSTSDESEDNAEQGNKDQTDTQKPSAFKGSEGQALAKESADFVKNTKEKITESILAKLR